MRNLIDAVDPKIFWSLLVGFALGIASTWKFARMVERVRDAFLHGVHHWLRAKDFFVNARDGIGAVVAVSGLFLAVVAVVGTLVFLRVTGH